MSNYERERVILKEIEKWENEHLEFEESFNDLNYEEWLSKLMNRLSPEIREQYIEKVDTLLFHSSSYIQNSEFLKEVRKKIILNAKVFDEHISNLDDLKDCTIDQLIYLSNQQIVRQRLLSLIQGGISGAGNSLLMSMDIPANVLLQLYSVQRIALSYGYNVFEPFELMVTLKIFQLATLPKPFRYQYWQELEEEVNSIDRLQGHFFETEGQTIGEEWNQFLARQVGKVFLLYFLKKKFNKKMPLAGVVVGSLANYKLAREITEIANYFYQKRRIMERLS